MLLNLCSAGLGVEDRRILNAPGGWCATDPKLLGEAPASHKKIKAYGIQRGASRLFT